MANGLVNLQTDLKSLRYGSMPLGSDKPYVTKDINNPPSSNLTSMEITKRIDDTSRIAQMLIDRPGLKYLLHEAELKQIGVGDRIAKARKGGKSIVGAVLGQLGNTAVGVVKLIGSTLAQVPVNGTGTHFVKEFRTDTYLQPSGGNNRSAFAQFFGAGGVEGAPLALEGSPIEGVAESNFGVTAEQGTVFYNTLESKYDYFGQGDAKAKKDNENPNKTLTQEDLANDNTFLAKDGKSIKLPGAPNETTAQHGVDTPQNLIKSQGITEADQDGSAWVGQQAPKDSKYNKYSDGKGKAKNPTEANITNASAGRSIETVGTAPTNFVPYDAIDISTTGSIGSDFTTIADKYASTSTYTGIDTEKSRGFVSSNNIISLTAKSNLSIDTTAVKGALYDASLTGSQLADHGQIDEAISKQWSDGNSSYTSTKTEDNVNASTTGNIINIDNTNADDFLFKAKSINNVTSTRTTGTANDSNVNRSITHLSSIRKEKRVGLGDQGRKKTSYSDYTTVDKLSQDAINMLDVSDERLDAAAEARDFAKLFFEVITPDGSKYLHFRAFIENIDDSYTADWQAHKYVGRAENFYTYAGFDRDISFSFKVAAATRKELRFIYRKMVYLASITAPTYGGVGGFMRGTLARVTVGSYFDQIPGVITSVKYSQIDGMPWEIALGQPEGQEADVQELPMGLQCSISFKPIHDFAPQTGFHHYFTSTDEDVTFFEEDKYVPRTAPAPTPPEPLPPTPTPPPPSPIPVQPRDEVVPVRVQDNTAVARNNQIPTEAERTLKANGLTPKQSLQDKNEEFRKSLEEGKKKKKYEIVNY